MFKDKYHGHNNEQE